MQALADHGNYMGMNAIWLVSVRKWQCCWARLLACVPACPFAFFALSCGIRAAGSSSSLRHCVTTLTNNLPPHQLPAITGLTGGGERGKVDGQAYPRRLRSRTAPPGPRVGACHRRRSPQGPTLTEWTAKRTREMGVVRCGPAEGEGGNDGKACPC